MTFLVISMSRDIHLSYPERLNGWKCGEILKEMTRKRLELLGLDPFKYHVDDYDVNKVKARKQHGKNKILRDFRKEQTQAAQSPRINVFHEAANNYHSHAPPVNELFEEENIVLEQDPLADAAVSPETNSMEVDDNEDDELNTSTSSVR